MTNIFLLQISSHSPTASLKSKEIISRRCNANMPSTVPLSHYLSDFLVQHLWSLGPSHTHIYGHFVTQGRPFKIFQQSTAFIRPKICTVCFKAILSQSTMKYFFLKTLDLYLPLGQVLSKSEHLKFWAFIRPKK